MTWFITCSIFHVNISVLFFPLSLTDGGSRGKKRTVWCLCWKGEFFVQAEQTFRPPVQSVRLLYCYQLLGWAIHSPFAPRAAVFRRIRRWFYKSFFSCWRVSTCRSLHARGELQCQDKDAVRDLIILVGGVSDKPCVWIFYCHFTEQNNLLRAPAERPAGVTLLTRIENSQNT